MGEEGVNWQEGRGAGSEGRGKGKGGSEGAGEWSGRWERGGKRRGGEDMRVEEGREREKKRKE